MELRSGEQQERENKGKKIIVISLVMMLILIVILGVVILILKQAENERIKIYIDNKEVSITPDFMLTDSESGETYFSFSRVTNLVDDYELINAGYKQFKDGENDFYVESENEVAMLEINSNYIYKSNSPDKLNFDKYKLEKPIVSYNEKPYGTAEAIQVAFNINVTYSNKNNIIYFYTLPYLVSYYKDQVKNYGYTNISEDFATQKAIVKDRIVVLDSNGKYRLLSTKNLRTPIGDKYNNLVYIDNTNEFIATSDIGTGIISTDGDIKISLRYDKVGLIDADAQLYYVSNNNLYGVLGQRGKVLVNTEYDEIGINRDVFPYAKLKNDMFLYNNCIPLKKNDKWGLADKNGNIILNFEYDVLGYIESVPIVAQNNNNKINGIDTSIAGNRGAGNVIVITEIEGIVVGKDGKYGVVNSIGKNIIPCEFDKIYSVTNEGKDEFYLETGNKTIKLTKYLDENKIYVQGYTTNQIDTNNTNLNTTVNTVKNTITNNSNTAIIIM